MKKMDEAGLQRQIIALCRVSHHELVRNVFAPLNGVLQRNPWDTRKANLMGMLSGVPDLCMPTHEGCIWVELKAPGREANISKNQHKMMEYLTRLGHRCYIAATIEDAMNIFNLEAVRVETKWAKEGRPQPASDADIVGIGELG